MATIKDVARKSGLSVSCVSKYLNHPTDVLQSTKDKIDAAIAELDFKPSVFAQSLRTKRTYIVVVLMESIVNPFFAGLFDRIRRDLELHGYITVLQTLSDHSFNKTDFSYADGIIICFPDSDKCIDNIHKSAGKTPIVVVHGHDTEHSLPSVLLNVGEGSGSAINYLYKSGCRSFISVGGAEKSSMSHVKVSAIKSYLCEYPDTSLQCYTGENSYNGGIAAINFIGNNIKYTDAIICESDVLATGVISQLSALGVSVPDEIKVIGYDDIPLASMFNPAITTIAIPSAKMCSAACDMMLKLLAGESVENKFFNPKLVVRRTA